MLKGKNGQPFYKDFWFWVKILIFAVFLLFLVYPFSTLVINSFFSTKAEGLTLYNFERFFTKKYYYQALGNSLKVSLVPTITGVLIGVQHRGQDLLARHHHPLPHVPALPGGL